MSLLFDGTEWTRQEKVVLGLTVSGALLMIGGAIWLWRQRSVPLGQVLDRVERDGMMLTHHRESTMPIQKRIKLLQGLVYRSVQDPRNRKLALSMTQNCPERDGKCEAEAIYRAIKQRVRYTGDVSPLKIGDNGPVEGIDLYQSAWRTWEFAGGDCDDHSTLAATMLALNGIPARFRVTAPQKNAEFSHIYVVAGVPKTKPTQWISIDTTLPGNHRFNTEAPNGRKQDFPI